MRRFAELWPDKEIVQQLLHNLPWFHICTVIDEVPNKTQGDWYVRWT